LKSRFFSESAVIERKNAQGKRDYDLEAKSCVSFWKFMIQKDYVHTAEFGKVKADDEHRWAKDFLKAAEKVDDPTKKK
jgi:hypothetical protein